MFFNRQPAYLWVQTVLLFSPTCSFIYIEANLIQRFLKKSEKKLAPSLNFTFRYIYDVLSLSNSMFGDCVDPIYLIDLDIKDTTDTDISASYLDLHLEIDSESQLRTKLYDKRDDFDFHIVNFPFICGNIPAAPAYGVYLSQLIRYSRACGSYQDFIWLELTTLAVISTYCIGSCKFNYHTNTTAPSPFLKYIFE